MGFGFLDCLVQALYSDRVSDPYVHVGFYKGYVVSSWLRSRVGV